MRNRKDSIDDLVTTMNGTESAMDETIHVGFTRGMRIREIRTIGVSIFPSLRGLNNSIPFFVFSNANLFNLFVGF